MGKLRKRKLYACQDYRKIPLYRQVLPFFSHRDGLPLRLARQKCLVFEYNGNETPLQASRTAYLSILEKPRHSKDYGLFQLKPERLPRYASSAGNGFEEERTKQALYGAEGDTDMWRLVSS